MITGLPAYAATLGEVDDVKREQPGHGRPMTIVGAVAQRLLPSAIVGV